MVAAANGAIVVSSALSDQGAFGRLFLLCLTVPTCPNLAPEVGTQELLFSFKPLSDDCPNVPTSLPTCVEGKWVRGRTTYFP